MASLGLFVKMLNEINSRYCDATMLYSTLHALATRDRFSIGWLLLPPELETRRPLVVALESADPALPLRRVDPPVASNRRRLSLVAGDQSASRPWLQAAVASAIERSEFARANLLSLVD